MTDPSVELAPCPLERLAEHLGARSPMPLADIPAVADWLDYSLNRCGLLVVEESEYAKLRHPSTELGDEVERVARKTVDFILSRWEIDNPPLASQLAKYTSQEILAALRQSTRSVDDGWRDIATKKPREFKTILVGRDSGARCVMPAYFNGDEFISLSIVGPQEFLEPTHWSELPHPPSTEICAEKACGRGKAGV